MKCFILSLALCIVLIIPIGATEIEVESIEGFSGETISVPVTLSGNPGFAGFYLQINYDKSQLKLTDIKKGTLLQSANLNKDLTTGRVQLVCTENLTGDGTLFTLQFNILEQTQYKTAPVSISLVDGKAKNLTNVNLEAIPCTFTGGTIACRTGELLVKDWTIHKQGGTLTYTILDAPKEPIQMITASYFSDGKMKHIFLTQDILTPGQRTLSATPSPGETIKVFFLNANRPLHSPLIYRAETRDLM